MQIVAYILIQAEPGKAWNIAKATSELEGVKTAHAVTGLYDVIVHAEPADLETLKDLIIKIQSIEGVQRTHTAVSV